MKNQKVSKMFCFIFLILLNCSIINCISLIGSKILDHTGYNRIIHASLTDKETGRVWQIREDVSSNNQITGRIEIKSTDIQANVFYSYPSPYDNKKRLVIHDNICDLYNYDLNWDNFLPGINKPLTNIILLSGPSILDRFANFDWKTGDDELIRGTVMPSVSTDLNGKLNITLYYPSNLNQLNGIQQPSQIVFTGHNPDTLVEGEPETLILDIYLQSQTDKKLAKTVQVTPGFGCPIYLNGDKEFPELNERKIHFIATEQINDDEKIINEFHADETYQTVRQSVLAYGIKQEMLFDFSIGAFYSISSSGDCSLKPIDSSSPGIDESGSFSISKLLWLPKTMKYLGEIIFEKRSDYNVHVWESIETNKVLYGEIYDKVVTTQYLSSSYKDDIFKGYSPVAATIKAYRKNDKNQYVLSDAGHRDYYDSNSDLPEYAYHEALQVTDCYKKPEQRLTLKFHLTCQVDGCIQKSQDLVYKMRELFKSSLLGKLGMSSNRVSNIDLKFQEDIIEAYVTFVEAPNINGALPTTVKNINTKSSILLHETTADTDESCLRYHSSFVPSGSAIAFCSDGKLCFSVANMKDLIETRSGTSCHIFTDPYKKLHRLGQEKLLSELHDHILGYFEHMTFKMDLDDKNKGVDFKVSDVIAMQEDVDKQKSPFTILSYYVGLDPIDDVNIVLVPGIASFGDCYRACAENEDISCETFSFCDSNDKKECIVSTWRDTQVLNNLTKDTNCATFSKNYLSEYSIRPNLKYKNPTTTSREIDITNCASECYTTPECNSFEYCARSECSFGGLITESNTEFSDSCEIYTAKASSNYKVTGKKLVSQVLYTEVDLDLDQCAILCEGDLKCASFNFCPKSKSSSQCQITSYSIKDPKTESVESSICHNFESKIKRNEETVLVNNSPDDIKASEISGSGVFGIVMLFLFIGLITGFVGPYVFTKVKSRDSSKSKNDFGWSKQEDDNEDSTQI